MANEYSKYDIVEGIAAALSGQVPQFEQRMATQRQTREKALYEDALAALNMAGRDNYQGIIDLTEDRMDILGRMGVPFDETKAANILAQRAAQGDAQSIETLKAGLNETVQKGYDLGILARPAPPEIVSYKEDENVYQKDPITGQLTQIVEAKKQPVDYDTYEQNGIQFYSQGPYAGLSVGRVAELQRSGVIQNFGDPIKEMPARPAPNVQVPLRPQPPQPDYSGMSQQEQAIVMQEQERQRLEEERAAAAESRLVAEEERAVQEAEREEEEAQETSNMMRNELITALGVIDNIILKAPMSVVKAVTGPIEGAAEGASKTTYLPFGASPQEAQDLISNINFLKSLQTMANLGRLKGVLSDSDIKMIQNAASGIDRKGSAQDLLSKVNALKDTIIDKLKTKYNLTDEQIAGMLPYRQEETAPNQTGKFDQILQQSGLLNNFID